MIHKVLRQNAQEYGGFTDLFILGSFRRYDPTTKTWGSDFATTGPGIGTDRTTPAAVAQTFNLIQLSETTPAVTTSQGAVQRYIPGYPLGMVVVKYPFSDTADNPKLDLGTGNSLASSNNLVPGTATDLELQDRIVLPNAAGIPVAANTVSQFLTATVTSAVANVSALVAKASNPTTVGVDIWIYVTLLPAREWYLNREA